MRILTLVEYYPTTYKPYFDDLFAAFGAKGHHNTVMAHGAWLGSASNPTAADPSVSEVFRYATTLKSLPALLPVAVGRTLRFPLRSIRRAKEASVPHTGAKQRLLHRTTGVLMPPEPPDMIIVHNTTTLSYFPFLKKIYPSVPIGFYYHGGEVAGTPVVTNRDIFGLPDVILTNTRASKAHAVSRGADGRKICVVPVGFRLSEFPDPGPRSYKPGGVLRLFSAGRVSDEKGFADAVHAVAALVRDGMRVEYTIVGDGPQRLELRHLIETLGLQSVVSLADYAPRAELLQQFLQTDAVLLPSVPTANWEETQACVLQEAMLMRVPVIASRIGGVPESVPAELHQFLFTPANIQEMADRIHDFGRLTDAELRVLTNVGRSFVTTNYDVGSIAQRMIDEIMGSASARR